MILLGLFKQILSINKKNIFYPYYKNPKAMTVRKNCGLKK